MFMASTKSRLSEFHIHRSFSSNRARIPPLLRGVVLLGLACFLTALCYGQPKSSRLNVVRRRIVLVRPPEVVRQFPKRRTAVVFYPVITGHGDPRVLQKVRDLLRIENIFEYSLEDYRKDPWLTEFNYRVNYNGDYIFDVTFTQSGMAAYPDIQTKHLAIDLKRGALMKAADVFETNSFKPLASIVNEKLQAELRQISARIRSRPDLEAAERNSLLEAFEDLKFEIANLDDFSVNASGMTFLYDAGFPSAHWRFEPRGRYFVPYAQLKPYMKSDSLLAQFVR
jgi:hypothetical protein